MTDEQYNGQIRAMAKATKQKMLMEMSRLNLKQTGALMQSLQVKTRKETFGLINNIRYSFARQGIFVKLGVSRGYGKKNGQFREKKDWFSSVLDTENEKIGDFAAQFKADETAKVLADAIMQLRRIRIV
jgi:hypothetical protein